MGYQRVHITLSTFQHMWNQKASVIDVQLGGEPSHSNADQMLWRSRRLYLPLGATPPGGDGQEERGGERRGEERRGQGRREEMREEERRRGGEERRREEKREEERRRGGERRKEEGRGVEGRRGERRRVKPQIHPAPGSPQGTARTPTHCGGSDEYGLIPRTCWSFP